MEYSRMKNFRFLDEMLGVVHRDTWLLPDFAPVKGEVLLNSDWCIKLVPEGGQMMCLAADDLAEFLRNTMMLSVPVVDSDDARDMCIELGCWPHVATSASPKYQSESYMIEVLHDKILVCGRDEAGCMYGAYALEEMMKFRGGPALAVGAYSHSPRFDVRIYRSPLSPYYDHDLLRQEEAYPEPVLRMLSHHGFNGIWVRSRFRDLIWNSAFPEFGKDADEHLRMLNDLIHRSANYNVKVYIYLTEPLGFKQNDPFFEKYPHVRGARYQCSEGWGGTDVWGEAENALCTSTDDVQLYLRDSTTNLLSAAPGLGGLILITASEHHSHCYSHVDTIGMQQGDSQFATVQECPRCANRTSADVVSEIINLIYESAVQVDPSTRIIAWNWAWGQYENDPHAELISRINPGVIWMGGFEAGAKLNIEGTEAVNEEYSLSYVGPSERFRDSGMLARQYGHPVFAKIQVGTTHEDATIPYFPVMTKVVEKLDNMAGEHVSGYMACWNFGNFCSPVTEIVNFLSWEPVIGGFELLTRIAARDYGLPVANEVVRAWKCFSEATDHYPLCAFLLGLGIHTRGPVYPFHFEPTGKRTPLNWRVIPYEDWGDEHEFWTGKLGLSAIMTSYAKMLESWQRSVRILESCMPLTSGCHRGRLLKHIGVAKMFYHQIKSTYNFLDFVETRNNMYGCDNSSIEVDMLGRLEDIAGDELEHCSEVNQLLQLDPQLGFHGEAFDYLIDEAGLNQKIEQIRDVISVRIPSYRRQISRSKTKSI
ncbi:MAG: beta-N-acetylhexosaminidase family protein [Armatimonadota bacterium]